MQEALKVTGYLATKAGCVVGVALWEYTETTKGVDEDGSVKWLTEISVESAVCLH